MIAPDARIVLDTSVLVKLLQGKEAGAAIENRYELGRRTSTPFISIVTVGELRAFSRSRNWGAEKRARLDDLLAELVIVDINSEDVLDAFADVSTYLKERGKTVGDNDRWIAATAKVLQATVLTTDGDFAWLHPEVVSCEIAP